MPHTTSSSHQPVGCVQAVKCNDIGSNVYERCIGSVIHISYYTPLGVNTPPP
jgi:hypothetical protein